MAARAQELDGAFCMWWTKHSPRLAELPAITRLNGEKEAFEQSNPTDDADEQELAKWNDAKDLEQQIKDIKGDNRDALTELKRLEKAAGKKKVERPEFLETEMGLGSRIR